MNCTLYHHTWQYCVQGKCWFDAALTMKMFRLSKVDTVVISVLTCDNIFCSDCKMHVNVLFYIILFSIHVLCLGPRSKLIFVARQEKASMCIWTLNMFYSQTCNKNWVKLFSYMFQGHNLIDRSPLIYFRLLKLEHGLN